MIVLLAAGQEPNNPDWGKAGPVALFVLLTFIVVCFFLFRSMSRRMRKVPASFDSMTPPAEQRLGTAKPVIPPREGDDSYEAYAARGGATPKLGTPADLLADSGSSASKSASKSASSSTSSGGSARAARREQIRQAKARRRAK